MKQRFPREEKRADIRLVLESHGNVPDESVFTVVCEKRFKRHELIEGELKAEKIKSLTNDVEFVSVLFVPTSQWEAMESENVTRRLQRSREIVGSL